jgi:hypothetical protein
MESIARAISVAAVARNILTSPLATVFNHDSFPLERNPNALSRYN